MGRKSLPTTGTLQIGDVLMSTNSSLSNKTWVVANGNYYSYANYPQYWAFKNPSYDGSPIVMTAGLSPECDPTRVRIISLSSGAHLKVWGNYPGSNHGQVQARVVNSSTGATIASDNMIDDIYMWSGSGSGERTANLDYAYYDVKNKVLATGQRGENGTVLGRFQRFTGSGTSWSIQTSAMTGGWYSYTYGNYPEYYKHPLDNDAVLVFIRMFSAYSAPNFYQKIFSYNSTTGNLSEVASPETSSSGALWDFTNTSKLFLDPVTSVYWAQGRMTSTSGNDQILWAQLNANLTLSSGTPPDIGRLVQQTLSSLTLASGYIRTDNLSLSGSGGVLIDPVNDRYFRVDGSRNATCYQYSTNNRLAQYDTKTYPFGIDGQSVNAWVGDIATGYFLCAGGNTSDSIYAGINKNTNPSKITFSVPSLSFSGVTTYVKAAG